MASDDEADTFDIERATISIWHYRKIGHGWQHIQEQIELEYGVTLTYNEIAAMYRSHMRALVATYGFNERDQMLGMEVERLDAMQAAWWDEAVNGDKDAAKVVLETMKQRQNITGLNMADPADRLTQQTVLVIGQDKDTWIEALTHGRDNRVIMPGLPRDDSQDDKES